MAIKILPYQLKKQVSYIKENYFTPSLEALTGNVLEIGCGKGENFKYYSEKCSVFAIDKKIEPEHMGNIQKGTRCMLYIQEKKADELKYKDEFFDAVISSFVLCSVDSLENTLDEISRVLKKGGKLIFIEHIKSNHSITKAFQKVLTPLSLLLKDCHLNRDPRYFLPKEKFHIISEKVFPNSLEPYLYLEALKR
ncbi:class I SAM-dependent methyltransferase [candidate division KSB1 bacterium]